MTSWIVIKARPEPSVKSRTEVCWTISEDRGQDRLEPERLRGNQQPAADDIVPHPELSVSQEQGPRSACRLGQQHLDRPLGVELRDTVDQVRGDDVCHRSQHAVQLSSLSVAAARPMPILTTSRSASS